MIHQRISNPLPARARRFTAFALLVGGIPLTLRAQQPTSVAPVGNFASAVQAIAVESNGTIWVGTETNGILRSADGGRSWTSAGLSDRNIRAIQVESDGRVLAVVGALKEPGSLPIQILVLLRNRSDEPLVLARKQTWEGRGHWMRIGHRGWQRGSRTAALDDPQNVELVATAWSDGDSPTLVLKKGDLKWLWLSGAIKGLCGAVGFNGLFLKVEIEEESTLTILRSPWYEGVYNPRSDTIRSDTIRSDTIRSDSTRQRDTASVTDPCR